MIEWSVGIAAISTIVAPLAAAAVRFVLSHGSHRNVQIQLQSGDRITVTVDPHDSDLAIKELVEKNTSKALKERETVAGH